MRSYIHHGSSDKIWAQEGRLFRQKVVIFSSSSSVIMNFLLDPFVHKSSSQKNSESLILVDAKLIKLTLFSLKSLTSLSPKFFLDFDNSYLGRHNIKKNLKNS